MVLGLSQGSHLILNCLVVPDSLRKLWRTTYEGNQSLKLILNGSVQTRFNPAWHDVRKQEKCSSLGPRKDKFYKTQ